MVSRVSALTKSSSEATAGRVDISMALLHVQQCDQHNTGSTLRARQPSPPELGTAQIAAKICSKDDALVPGLLRLLDLSGLGHFRRDRVDCTIVRPSTPSRSSMKRRRLRYLSRIEPSSVVHSLARSSAL